MQISRIGYLQNKNFDQLKRRKAVVPLFNKPPQHTRFFMTTRITQLQEEKKRLEKENADYLAERGSLNIPIKSNEKRIRLIDEEITALRSLSPNDDLAQ